jgi:lipopolysaccharide export system protein LptA
MGACKCRPLSKDSKKAAKPTTETPTAGAGSSIERIEVEGNVFLATPKETAQGRRGHYQLSTNMIYLYDDVVLTSGENIIRGEELVHNRATSRSKVSANTTKTPTSGKKKRVKSVFVPEEKNN